MTRLQPSRFAIVGPLFLFLVALSVLSQQPEKIVTKKSTAERMQEFAWWPTKPMPSAQRYAGAQACGVCHGGIYDTQHKTAMANTAMPANASRMLHTGDSIRQGDFTYSIKQGAGGLALQIARGDETRSQPLTWALGDGSVGQSYLSEIDGSFYEARFSFFGSTHGFDGTPGRMQGPPLSMSMATGRVIGQAELKRCFACHSAGMLSDQPFHPRQLQLGVSCEACHGPGAEHAADPYDKAHAIFDPRKLKPEESVDFCGSCHGTWWDAALIGSQGVQTVRFPAYRLEQSQCWGKGDARITCVACHDPHQALQRSTAAYDQKCLSCHVNAPHSKPTPEHPGKACPVARADCASCHMPKYDFPEMHAKFTDHRIRVVRKAEGFVE